ncbi:MAG: hypothetical protein QOJ79_1762 [Actinomycetota bacterium]|jgi:hypothetical protein|nr:hypothetical protein [Actinomycetota bacterium]
MVLSAEQWLQTHFFPLVDSLPAPADADPSSPTTALAVIAALRLSGAVDALAAVGALDVDQQERCRAALEAKGVSSAKVSTSSVALFSGLVEVRGNRPEPEPDPRPDRLVRVLGDGRVFGLVEGEQAVLIAVEVWERSVHADFLIAVDPAAHEVRDERARLMRDWLQKKHAGEATDADRPLVSMAMSHPGAATTWLLEADGRSVEGRVASGQGGQDWWRLRVQWDVAADDSARELVVSGTEEGRVIGRSVLAW